RRQRPRADAKIGWVAHYSRLASEWLDQQKAAVGERWHIDETYSFKQRVATASPATGTLR
ncbi:MAG: hypothetical protein ACREDE_08160, partial [Thermoplasmata archaeon]